MKLQGMGSSDVQALVHWCHGAPGAAYLFAKAYEVRLSAVERTYPLSTVHVCHDTLIQLVIAALLSGLRLVGQ